MKIIKTIFFAAVIVIGIGLVVNPDARAAQDSNIYTYVFHLYYDSGKLAADRDFQIPFDLIAEQFQQPAVKGTVYHGEIVSIKSVKLADFQFDLNIVGGGNGKGKLTIKAPYFSDAKTANFYNSNGQSLLSIDVAPQGPVCNDNGVCDSAVGETSNNCPSDCIPTPSPTVLPSSVISPSTSPTTGGSSAGIWQSVIYILVGIVLIGILVFLLKLISRKSGGSQSDQSQNNPPPPLPPQT